MIAAQTHQILTLRFCQGAKHDFQLFKDSKLALDPDDWYVADSGYQGLQKHHPSVNLPFKKSKHHPLTEAQKQHNTALSKFRIRVEHVIRSLKIWRILKETYRNRRKRFTLRVSLIAAIFNAELDC
jgi:IS5 family transposase